MDSITRYGVLVEEGQRWRGVKNNYETTIVVTSISNVGMGGYRVNATREGNGGLMSINLHTLIKTWLRIPSPFETTDSNGAE